METVKQYLKHPMMFLNALLGRPNPVSIPEGQVTYQGQQSTDNNQQTTVQQNVPSTQAQPVKPIDPEDPLYQDLEKATSVLKKITSKLKKTTDPLVAQGSALSTQAVSSSQAFAKTDKFKKIIPIIIFAGALLVLVIIAIWVVVPLLSRMGTKEETPIVITSPTPPPIEFTPSEPSVYANDPNILDLEEDIAVLDREIVGASLRETTLNPPTLDYNISF